MGANRGYSKKPVAFMDGMIAQMKQTAEELGVTMTAY